MNKQQCSCPDIGYETIYQYLWTQALSLSADKEPKCLSLIRRRKRWNALCQCFVFPVSEGKQTNIYKSSNIPKHNVNELRKRISNILSNNVNELQKFGTLASTPRHHFQLQSSAMWGKRRKIQQSLLVHNLEISGNSTLSEIYTNKKTHNIRKSRYLLHFEGVNG